MICGSKEAARVEECRLIRGVGPSLGDVFVDDAVLCRGRITCKQSMRLVSSVTDGRVLRGPVSSKHSVPLS